MNDIVIKSNSELMMSSLDIADLTGKQHSHVKRDIRVMLEELQIDASKFGYIYLDTLNREQRAYWLPKDETLCLMAGYDVKARMVIIKRWQELEAGAAVQIPQTLSQALRLAADQADQIEEQQKMLEFQKPAVEFVEKFVEAKSSRSLREVAKVLGVKEGEFIARLINERILFRQSGNILPIATHQHAGRFTVKTGSSNGHAFQQTRFTPMGITWISKRFGLISGENAA